MAILSPPVGTSAIVPFAGGAGPPAPGSLIPPLADSAVVYEYSYSTGTGPYTLAGAVGSWKPFSSSYADGATVVYRATDDSARVEYVIGEFNATAGTLTRTVILGSSNGNNPIDWSGRTRVLLHALVQGLPLCETPPTDGQVLAWDAVNNEWCPETIVIPPPSSFPLCATPPTDGQILVWDAMNNEWCPADLCALVTACLTPPTPGAVLFDGSAFLYNFPAMLDSPTGSLSFWIYIPDPPPSPLASLTPANIFFFSDVALITGGASGSFLGQGGLNAGQGGTQIVTPSITGVTNANPAVVTFSAPHMITSGAWVEPLTFQQGSGSQQWSQVSPHIWSNAQLQVLSVTSMTMALDVDTSGWTAYNAGLNPNGYFNVYNAPSFFIQDATQTNDFNPEFSTPIPSNQWVNVLASWDTNRSAGNKIINLYYNDTQITKLPWTGHDDVGAAFTIPYSNPSTYSSDRNDFIWSIGGAGNAGGSGSLSGGIGVLYLAEWWFAPGQLIDPTDSATRAKFRDAMGHPVSLGADGSTPTGVKPALYQTIVTTAPDPYTALGLPLRVVSPGSNSNSADLSGNLTNGITSSSFLTFSVWVWGMQDIVLVSWSSRQEIYIVNNTIEFDLAGPGGENFNFRIIYDPTGAAAHSLTNIRVAIDTNHAIGAKIVTAYVNNTDVSGDVIVDFDNANSWQMDFSGSYEVLNGRGFLDGLWFAPDQFFDPGPFFIDGSGNPTNIGAGGSTPSGTAPSLYFNVTGSQPANDLPINLGTGGTFTRTGDFSLLPDGAAFCKNNTGGKNMILNPDFNSFGLAPIAP